MTLGQFMNSSAKSRISDFATRTRPLKLL